MFVEAEDDYNKVLDNIKAEKISSHHTYTSKQDKTHAFVLRGVSKGSEIPDIKEDLEIA